MTDWKAGLDEFFQQADGATDGAGAEVSRVQAKVDAFLETVAVPAFEQIRVEMEGHGREVQIHKEWNCASIVIRHNREVELDYSINIRVEASGAFPFSSIRAQDRGDGQMHATEGKLRGGRQDYTIADITKEAIVAHCLSAYTGTARYSSASPDSSD